MLEPMSHEMRAEILSGWGNSSPSSSRIACVSAQEGEALLSRMLAGPSTGREMRRGVTMRGLGRSYGDAAQNGGGAVVRLHDDLERIHLDADNALVHAPAGVSLDDLMAFLVPRGFFVPVTPGTRFVTLGGAVASDIHGKNHHVDGSFGSHVVKLSILLASGTVVEVSPQVDPDLFWATIGGMGLTGAILGVTFRAIRIETSRCTVSTRRYENLDLLLAAMSEGDDDVTYSVAWTDLLATGSALGRSILWRGEHSKLDELTSADDPLSYETKSIGSIPRVIPSPGVVNKWTSKVFNELWYRTAPRKRDGQIKSIPAYFHPLDSVAHWNRLYGPHGFLQYQFVVPFGAETTLRTIVSLISDAEVATPLVVLKRFGAGNPGMLSFPQPGWTLTVDIASRVRGLCELLSRLDRLVLDAGGRHYLAKDSHMSPQTFSAGYPRLGEWLDVKHRVDPKGVWTSDLARRLELVK